MACHAVERDGPMDSAMDPRSAAADADGDIFSAALTVEHDAVAAGRQRGKRDGMKQGYYEGRDIGLRKGAELGTELAFYAACVRTWTALARAQPLALNQKSATTDHTRRGAAIPCRCCLCLMLPRCLLRAVLSEPPPLSVGCPFSCRPPACRRPSSRPSSTRCKPSVRATSSCSSTCASSTACDDRTSSWGTTSGRMTRTRTKRITLVASRAEPRRI